MGGHEAAVAQDNNAIGDARDLFEPVANVDKADPLFPQLVNLREQRAGSWFPGQSCLPA